MTVSPKKFHAKILLLGEYTVTVGSGALAVPYPKYGGCWSKSTTHGSDSSGLLKLMNHIQAQSNLVDLYDLVDFAEDLNEQQYFDSDIPQGYGLGSSGALVAAFYERYAYRKTEDLKDLKSILALTECAFHGTSSGIDPLVSYLDRALLYRGSDLQIPDRSSDLRSFFILDTGKPRDTGHLVRLFRDKIDTSPDFRKIVAKLSDYNDEAIEGMVQHRQNALFELFGHISQIQFEHFRPMIPVEMVTVWKKGLDTGDYLLKICGAGGGGMMMGLRPEGSALPEFLGAYAPLSLV